MPDDLLTNRSAPSLASQLSLRGHLMTLSKRALKPRLQNLGLPTALADDRTVLQQELSRPERFQRILERLRPSAVKEAVERVLDDHGGVVEAGNLERVGIVMDDPERWREILQTNLVGTILAGSATDVGLRLSRGSLVLFPDLVRGVIEDRLESSADEEPEPPADVLADLSGVRTYLDHHAVRVTRDGTLYRTTARKMRGQVLTPGARPMAEEAALDFLFRFLRDAELVTNDSEGRLRVREDWSSFEERGPVERTELLLTYVINDVRGAKGEFHQSRLRRLLLNVLRERGLGPWLDLRRVAQCARNRYFANLDPGALADRYQKRYKYTPLPPLAGPAGLVSELVRFASESLTLLGVVQVSESEGGAPVVRLTRLGASALGMEVPESGHGLGRPLVVTADFEAVLFPDQGGTDLVHEIGLFAKREKADFSLHYRISERSVQEAVAKGLDGDAILAILTASSRHEIPDNVATSIRHWADGVSVLNARRAWLLRAETPLALEALLSLGDVQSALGERLSDTTVELLEDPSNPRIADILRTHGFFLR